MADWTSIVDRIVRAEQDVKVARELLHRAEADEKAARAALAQVMGRQPTRAQQIIAEALNGGGHSPSHAPPPPVRQARPTKDYDRRHRALELIQSRGGFLSISEFAAADRCGKSMAANCLGRLTEEGILRRVARGRYALGPAPTGAGATQGSSTKKAEA